MTNLKLSFEFFPPKTPEAESKLWENIKTLEKLNPHFVSVTYGAGGSTREKTHEIVTRIVGETKLKPAAHLTCVNATREEIDAIARKYWESGVKHIVALRGDPPDFQGLYVPYVGGYEYAADLVKGLKKVADFEISVAAYPETHPSATSPEDDLAHLKEKIDAGATRAITQFFFDVNDYFRFIERTQKIGIKVPIVPGILPISNLAQATRFANMCGAKIPPALTQKLGGVEGEDFNKASVEYATDICRKLIDNGIDQIHFYTLNRADLTKAVVDNLM